MNRILFISIILVLFASCKNNSIEPQSSEDDDIREIVFRYQFASNGSGFADTTAKYYYLAIIIVDSTHRVTSSSDPSDDLMKRFISNTPQVRKYSQATIQPGGGVYDKETGLRGLLFRVGQIRRVSENDAEVEGGYYAGGLNAEGDVFYLRKANSSWFIYRVQNYWVS
jgi:hypothetical protein